MAEDDAKGRAKRKPQIAKNPPARKPPAKSAAASAPTAKTRAKPAAGPNSGGGSSSPPPPPSGSGARRRLPMGLLGPLAAITIVAALVLAWPAARDRLGRLIAGPAPSPPVAAPPRAGDAARWAKLADRLAALDASLARLGTGLAALKSAPVAGPDAATGLAALERRLAALEARPGRGRATAAALAAMDRRLAAMTGGLKAMEDRLQGAPVASDGAGGLVLLALAGALRRGVPHGVLAAAARAALAKSDSGAALAPRLHALAGYAAKGVPGNSALAARLEALPGPVGAAVPKPAGTPRAERGLWDQVTRRMSQLVVIRRVGEVPAPGRAAWDGARMAALRALAAGDVAGALAALSNAEGSAVAAWRRDAAARLEADALAQELDAMIARRLGRAARAP